MNILVSFEGDSKKMYSLKIQRFSKVTSKSDRIPCLCSWTTTCKCFNIDVKWDHGRSCDILYPIEK